MYCGSIALVLAILLEATLQSRNPLISSNSAGSWYLTKPASLGVALLLVSYSVLVLRYGALRLGFSGRRNSQGPHHQHQTSNAPCNPERVYHRGTACLSIPQRAPPVVRGYADKCIVPVLFVGRYHVFSCPIPFFTLQQNYSSLEFCSFFSGNAEMINLRIILQNTRHF